MVEAPIFRIVSQEASRLNIKVWIVGGYVRDALLGSPSKDIDFVCEGDAPALAQQVAKRLGVKDKVVIYRRFGTAAIFVGDYQIEFSTARKESYSPDSRKPSVQPATIEEDFLRRDFTVNTLTVSLNKEDYGWLIDPFGGLEDLEKRLIRTPTNPESTFYDDPLRMLRAIRFAVQLNFNIEQDTFNAIRRECHRIEVVSAERICDELNKMLMAKLPARAFQLMDEAGLLELILPELTALKGVEEKEGIKHKDNFYHTLQVLDNAARLGADLWTRWAALLHDIGKAPTKRFDPQEGWTFHGHEAAGARMVKCVFERLRLPLHTPYQKVKTLVELHQRPVNLLKGEISDAGVRRLVVDAGEWLDDLLLLCKADITTASPLRRQRYLRNLQKLEKRIQEVIEKDRLRHFQPPISGEIIMKVFGIPPSHTVGEIKQAIKDAILDGTIPNEFTAAFNYMLQVAKEKGLQPRLTLEEFLQEARTSK